MSASAQRIRGRVGLENTASIPGWRWSPDVQFAQLVTYVLVEPISRSVLLGLTLQALDYVSKPSALFVWQGRTAVEELLSHRAL